MDTPNRSTDCARPSPWLEQTLIRVSTIATAAARAKCRPDVADDIAQDIVLGFIERHAAGRLTEPPTYLDALVRRMVKQALIDRGRRAAVRAQHEADYADAMADTRREWMHPEDGVSHEELGALHADILDTLCESRRRAFLLVRENDVTYEQAGEALGLTRLAVCKHVTAAQRTFRERLSSAGIIVSRHQPAARRSRSVAHRHDR